MALFLTGESIARGNYSRMVQARQTHSIHDFASLFFSTRGAS